MNPGLQLLLVSWLASLPIYSVNRSSSQDSHETETHRALRERLSQRVDSLEASGQSEDAVAELRNLLQWERDVFGDDSLEVVPSLRRLSDLYLATDHFEFARDSLEEALWILEDTYGEPSGECFQTKVSLHRLDDAREFGVEQYFRWKEAWALLGDARRQLDQSMTDEAIQSIQASVRGFETLPFQTNYEMVTALSLLGAAAGRQRRFEDAEELLSRALTLNQEDAEAADPYALLQYCDILTVYGLILRKSGRATESRQRYEQCLNTVQALYPDPQGSFELAFLARVHNNLASTLQDLKEYDAANDHYLQSLQMRRQAHPRAEFPDGHTDVAEVLNNLGTLAEGRDQLETAESYYRQALEIRSRVYSGDQYPHGHELLAESLRMLGKLCIDQGNLIDAESLLARATAMYRNLLAHAQTEGFRAALCMDDLGRLYLTTGKLGRRVAAPNGSTGPV